MAAKDLTSGSIPALVVRLALPTLASFLLQSMYQLADLVFVGMLGGEALAALSIAVNTFFVTLALGMTVGIGALALMSQAYGRGARTEVTRVFQQALWMGAVFAVALWGAGVLGARPYMRVFTADAAVVELGTGFFRIYAAALGAQLIGVMLGNCFRAVGDFVTPMLLMGTGVLLNLVLDPLLIFGLGPVPALGLHGAAWATLVSQATALLAAAWLLARPGAVLALRRPWHVDWRVMGRMLRIGVPSGLQFALFAATMMLTFRYVRPFGPEATAAVGVGFRIIETGIFPLVSIGTAVSSLVGQNFGARRLHRVKATLAWGMLYGTGIALAEFALLAWQPAFWMGLFTADGAVLEIGARYLAIVGLVLVIVGPVLPAEFAGMGLGRTLLPLLAQVVRLGALVALLTLFVDIWALGLAGVFWARALSVLPECGVLLGVLAYWWATLLRGPAPAAAHASGPSTAPESP